MADDEKRAIEANDKTVKESSSFGPAPDATTVHANGAAVEEEKKEPFWKSFLEPGHAVQIVFAAALAIGISLAVTATVGQTNVPKAVPAILAIPGTLWLRCLQAIGKSEVHPGLRRAQR